MVLNQTEGIAYRLWYRIRLIILHHIICCQVQANLCLFDLHCFTSMDTLACCSMRADCLSLKERLAQSDPATTKTARPMDRGGAVEDHADTPSFVAYPFALPNALEKGAKFASWLCFGSCHGLPGRPLACHGPTDVQTLAWRQTCGHVATWLRGHVAT